MIEVRAVSNLYRLCLFPEKWGQNIYSMQDLDKIWSWLNQKNAKQMTKNCFKA